MPDASAVIDFIVLGALWLAMVLVIDPVGNFPLDDDWSYGRAVQNLVEHHSFRLTGFTAMPLIAQVAWGALFSVPAGFSFTALRLSTIFLGLIGVLATYALLREVRAGRGVAFFGALSIALNPLYCLLSFTFMTDVPFFAFSVLAVLFLVRGTLRRRTTQLAIGFLFAGIALLIRQPAILLLVGFGVTYLLSRGVSRSTVIRAVAPTIVAAGILVGYRLLLVATTGLPALYGRPYDPVSETAASLPQALAQILDRLLVAAIYVGLFVLPVAIVVSAEKWHAAAKSRRWTTVAIIAAGGVTAVLAWSNRIMPLSGNVLYDEGLGPPLLRDVYILRLHDHLPRAPREVWLLATAAGVVGSALVVQRVASTVFGATRRWLAREPMETSFAPVFALTACLSYLIAIAVTGYLDRYLIFVLPLVLVATVVPDGASLRPRKPVVLAAGVLLGLYGLFSVASTHDYLSWNRARWIALRHLTQEAGVSRREIDGGFEFNGWYAYDPAYRERPGKSSWWVEDDKYVISFGPLRGYEIAERYQYRRWMPPGRGKILVLRRLYSTRSTSDDAAFG